MPRLETAESTHQAALQYELYKQTAKYRLGLISLLHQDFKMTKANLEAAHQPEPNDRDISKSLGYCFVWFGDMDKAQVLLERIPEVQDEMKVYSCGGGYRAFRFV